jgi:hypothetical protein
MGHRLFDFVLDQGAAQLIIEPTRVTRSYYITNMPDLFTEPRTLPPLHELCDHCAIHGKLNFPIPANATHYKEFLNTRNVNWVSLNTALELADWESCFSDLLPPEISIENWIKLLHQIIRICSLNLLGV